MLAPLLERGPTPIVAVAATLLLLLWFCVKRPCTLPHLGLYLMASMIPLAVGIGGYRRSRAMCYADWNQFMATNPSEEVILHAKESLLTALSFASDPLHIGIGCFLILVVSAFIIFAAVRCSARRQDIRGVHMSCLSHHSGESGFTSFRLFLSFGSYLKLLGVLTVSYIVANELLYFFWVLWRIYYEDPGSTDILFSLVHMVVTVPIQAALQVTLVGCLAYPVFRGICSARKGIKVKGIYFQEEPFHQENHKDTQCAATKEQ